MVPTPYRRALPVLAALVALAGCAPMAAPTLGQPTGTGTTATLTQPRGQAVDVLDSLAVKGRAPITGYDREQFGQAWLDADRNGCDTRNDVLKRDLTGTIFKPGTRNCLVLKGTLADPYTHTQIDFVRGDGDLVDIDHVVALGNAWVTGAFRWEDRKRAALANDPMNLLAVDASANRQKGDGDAATWLPRSKAFRCDYVARQVAVKAKYGLWVTVAEKAAITRVLDGCPGQRVPADSGAPVLVPVRVNRSTERDGGGLYADCAAARAAGAAPVHRGDRGYSRQLDRDGDGTACE